MLPNRPNPHEAVRPDFTSDQHADACRTLSDTGVPENLAAAALLHLWTIDNEREKTEWDRITAQEVREEEEARHLAAAAKEILLQQDQAEKEAALAEERKKHKTKFIPVPKAKALVNLICLPAKYVLKQMESGGYVELFYFTNQGISDAEEVATTPDDDTYVWKRQDDGTCSFVETSIAKKGLKTDLLPDEKLSWEQFFEATPRLIKFMTSYQWPQDRIDMFCSFFLGIQSHPWRTSVHPFCKKALLVYQAKQRHLWHHTIGSPVGFSLAEIEEEILKNMRDELMQLSFNAEYTKLQSVSHSLSSLRTGLLTMSHAPSIFILFLISRPHGLCSTQINNAQLLAPSPRYSTAPNTSHSLKRPAPPPTAADPPDPQNKRHRFRPSSPLNDRSSTHSTTATSASTPPVLSVCAVCLGQEWHTTSECTAAITWDKQFETLCTRINRGLVTRYRG